MKVVETKPATMAEARGIMEGREKGAKELGYEQKLSLEHLKSFTHMKEEDAKKFMSDLSSILRMSPETAVQIANILPKTPDELRMIFAREKFSLKEEEINKILDLVKKYA